MGHAIGIGGDEHHAADDRNPDADDIDAVEDDVLPRLPGQGQVHDGQQRSDGGREQGHEKGLALRQRRSRDRDRGEQQQRERVFQSAGQGEQPAELAQIEGQLQGGNAGREPEMRAVAQHQADIERRREDDEHQAFEQRQREAQTPADEEDPDGLPDNGQPAQQHQGLQTQGTPTRWQGQCGCSLVGHAGPSEVVNCGA